MTLIRKTLIAMLVISSVFTSCKSHRHTASKNAKSNEKNKESHSPIQIKYAGILGVSPNQITNESLYKFIDHWYGTPYKYGGLSTSGVDCSGFVNSLYNQVYYKPIPRTTKEIADKSKSVSKNSMEEGDIVIFDIEGKKHSHVGVYLQNGHFVHASSSKGVIISNLNNPYFVKAFNRAGKL